MLLGGPSAAACAQTATLKGRALFKGEKPPRMKAVAMSADAYCQQAAAALPSVPRHEAFVVNPDRTIRDVFVYVKAGLPDRPWPVPKAPAVLEQKGCMYRPHVLGVRAGQWIEIRNADDTAHNIHALAQMNRPFNIGQPRAGMVSTEMFRNAEAAMRIKCDVHPWMYAWCHVMSHPFFAVTGEDGAFEIKDLPPGTYEIAAWQEKKGEQTTTIALGAGETKELNFEFEWKSAERPGENDETATTQPAATQAARE